MNRLEFGALVAALREDMRWTQAELAEKCDVDVAVISNIERGERRGLLKDGLLLKLAVGLQLTTLERREFLFASSGFSENDVLRPQNEINPTDFDSLGALANLRATVASLRSPAFVTDAYCDVLLANRCASEFLQVPRPLLETAASSTGGYNLLRILFHPEANYRARVGADWERQALLNLRFFRRVSLRYRTKPYFSALMREFTNHKKYPLFERYWRKTLANDSDEYSGYACYSIAHPELGTLDYVGTEAFAAMTPYGELYIHTYHPANDLTARVFENIYTATGAGYDEYAPFPDKRKK
jgi:transcriptional regulator with XRE-family HTH domain